MSDSNSFSQNLSIHSIWVYPVKSFRGYECDCAVLSQKGIVGDREWMVIKPNNRMLTQRQAPQMAMIATQLSHASEDGNKLVLSRVGQPDNSIAVPDPDERSENQVHVKVHKDTCVGSLASERVNDWITQQLEWPEPLRLVKFNRQHKRLSTHPERFADNATFFADAAPYLIANIASLNALNQHLDSCGESDHLNLMRFRPNIVLSGMKPFDEHAIEGIDISQPDSQSEPVGFNLIDHCQRCIMITVDPDTGTFTNRMAPFTELAKINPMPENDRAPAFGVNATLKENVKTATICKNAIVRIKT